MADYETRNEGSGMIQSERETRHDAGARGDHVTKGCCCTVKLQINDNDVVVRDIKYVFK